MIYKTYQQGNKFYLDNCLFLNESLFSKIQTAFFKGNSIRVTPQEINSFAFTLEEKGSKIACLYEPLFNGLLYGDFHLAKVAGTYAAQQKPFIKRILGEESAIKMFSLGYCEGRGCSYTILQQMSILYLTKLQYIPTNTISSCKEEDLLKLLPFVISFHKEALHETVSYDMAKEFLKKNSNRLYFLKENEQIVSMAMITREEEDICAISHVFTDKIYRGHGYAKEVVSYLAGKLLGENKVPYLYVDQLNPISNHLYTKIGFEPICNQIKVEFK